MNRKSISALALAAVASVFVLASGTDPLPAAARGGAGTPPASRPNPAHGPIYFDQSVAWVNDGKPGIHKVSDFYADLADVQFNVGNNHHEGYMRLWLKEPGGKYRMEMRQKKQMVNLTTKILSGQKMWVVHPGGRTERMHGQNAGVAAIRQLQDDRKRLVDLASFLTLKGLKGPQVKFENLGPTTGSGTFKGNWIKVKRTIPDGAEVIFHLAYERDPRDPAGRTKRATYPGVVTIVGDPRRKEPTEYYLLQNWKRGPQFRYPGLIQAFSQDKPGSRMKRFLVAFPSDIRINTGLEDSLFAPRVAKR